MYKSHIKASHILTWVLLLGQSENILKMAEMKVRSTLTPTACTSTCTNLDGGFIYNKIKWWFQIEITLSTMIKYYQLVDIMNNYKNKLVMCYSTNGSKLVKLKFKFEC